MEELQSETLTLVRAALQLCKEESSTLFASADDCDFFRTLYRKTPPQSSLASPIAPLSKKIITELTECTEKKREARNEAASTVSVSSVIQHRDSFQDIREILTKIAPSLRLLDAIPSDIEAKRVANRWKTKNQSTPLSVLFFGEPESHRKLLEHLALALHVVFGNASLIAADSVEQEQQWEAFLSVPELKLIIVCDATLWQLPNLLKFYREVPSQNQRFLHQTPLFLLPDLTLYLKDPLLKRSLWKAISVTIETLECRKEGL